MNDVIVYESGHGLYINLTNRCPNDCVFCIRKKTSGINAGESLWLEKEPTYDEIITAISKKLGSEYNEIVFCGFGEPTERLDELLRVARYVKDTYPSKSVRLNTNGLSDLINKRPTAEELSAVIDAVSISLNAANKTDYNEICRPVFGSESYGAMLQFAADCNERIKDVCFTIIDTMCEDEQEQCRELCERLKIRLRIRKSL